MISFLQTFTRRNHYSLMNFITTLIGAASFQALGLQLIGGVTRPPQPSSSCQDSTWQLLTFPGPWPSTCWCVTATHLNRGVATEDSTCRPPPLQPGPWPSPGSTSHTSSPVSILQHCFSFLVFLPPTLLKIPGLTSFPPSFPFFSVL